MDIDGSGSSVNYLDAIVSGTILRKGDPVSALANVADETYQGLETRIMQSPHGNGSFDDLDSGLVNTDLNPYVATLVKGDSQLIIIPAIVGAWPPDGSGTISYFRPFVLTGCEQLDVPEIDLATGLLLPTTTKAVYVSGMFLSEALITTDGVIGGLDDTHSSIIKVIRLVPNPE